MEREPRSVLSGLLILLGAWEVFTGVNWITRPTPSRVAGVAWMDLPITESTIGWALVIGGILTLGGGLLSRWKTLENIGTALGIAVPLLCAAPFVGAFFESGEPARLQTVASYSVYSLGIAWVASRRVVTLPPHKDGDR